MFRGTGAAHTIFSGKLYPNSLYPNIHWSFRLKSGHAIIQTTDDINVSI